MKIVFFGSPSSAFISLRKILEAGHQVELVITQPDKPSGRGKRPSPSPVKKFALEKNIPTYEPEKIRKDSLAFEKIKEMNPDLIVVVAYGQIIPTSIITLPKYHSLNVHFSLLPKYRGASPVQWAILNGETKTGVTIFELNEKMDEGDILAQEEVEILPREKAFELEFRLVEKGAELLLKTISQISKKRTFKQDHSQATYAPKLNKDDGRIDWTKPALFIDRQVRAFSHWPSAFTFFKEKRIKILEGKIVARQAELCSPGEIVALRKEGIEVCCGERSIYLIERLQPENKTEMTAYAYTLGARLKPGDAFG